MAFNLGPLSVENPYGLYALLSIIPFIILYLIKPKPKIMAVPSLMFFIKMSGANKITSFFKQLVKDWLFFLQLLALLLSMLIISQPAITYMHDITSSNTIIVLDASASMQTREGDSTRFQISVEKAKELLGRSNTIILAKYFPQIALKDAGYGEAKDFLNSLRATESSTRLGDALLLAGETLGSREGRIVAISDFLNTDGQDPETARAVLKSKKQVVDFINVASQEIKNNLGFIDLIAEDDSTTVYIKNFGIEQKTITLKAGLTEKQMSIGAGHVEPFVFQTSEGITKLEILEQDDLPADNTAWLSAPQQLKIKVLLITNNKSIFLENALKASNLVDLEIAEPPVIPKGSYDLYILQDINPKEILTGTFDELADYAEKGANIIIHSQENQKEIDLSPIAPITVSGVGDLTSLTIQQFNRFTKNMDFGSVKYYLKSQLSDGFITLVTADSTPMISYKQKGKGKIVYYGILEKSSDFKFQPSYPIFWTELLKFLTERQDIKKLNAKTNQMVILDSPQNVRTPTRLIPNTASLFLENSGLYVYEGKTVAVNLLDEKESAINSKEVRGQKSTDYKLEPVKDKTKYIFEYPLIIALILIFAFEVFYIKIRGDV